MNRKLFRVITVVLAVLIVGQLLNLALQIHSDIYHYSYDEDTIRSRMAGIRNCRIRNEGMRWNT